MNENLLEVDLPISIRDETAGEEGQQYLHYLQRLLGNNVSSFLEGMELPILIVRKPRWPLKEILFVLRGDRRDLPAINWMVLLARRSKATVTVLVVHPDIPAMYTRFPGIQLDLPMLLQLENGTGALLRSLLHRMDLLDISVDLHERKATPHEQIRQEVVEGNFDLVIISREGRGRLWRWYFGEIITPLLRWIDRPVLIV